MNVFEFPPLAALLDAASALLGALGGGVSPGIAIDLVAFGLLLLVAGIAWASRRATRAVALPVEPAQQRIAEVLSWTPFLTVVFAAIVPLAATLYLAVSTGWTLLERMIMRRVIWSAPEFRGALPGAG